MELACVHRRFTRNVLTKPLEELANQGIRFLDCVVFVRFIAVLNVYMYLSVSLSQPRKISRAFGSDLQVEFVHEYPGARKLSGSQHHSTPKMEEYQVRCKLPCTPGGLQSLHGSWIVRFPACAMQRQMPLWSGWKHLCRVVSLRQAWDVSDSH